MSQFTVQQEISSPQQLAEEEVLRACRLIMAPGNVHELRIADGGSQRVIAGYFSDPVRMTEAAIKLDGRYPAIYITLNPCKPELLSRCCNRVEPYAKLLTGDKDIIYRRLLMIDADPRRSAGISSTDEQHERAIRTAFDIASSLRGKGWPAPIVADSGNGAHLLYLLLMAANTPEVATKVRTILERLNARYGTNEIGIDTTVHNAARITKLYGTMVCKGDSTPERPHRRSGLLEVPPILEALEIIV